MKRKFKCNGCDRVCIITVEFENEKNTIPAIPRPDLCLYVDDETQSAYPGTRQFKPVGETFDVRVIDYTQKPLKLRIVQCANLADLSFPGKQAVFSHDSKTGWTVSVNELKE